MTQPIYVLFDDPDHAAQASAAMLRAPELSLPMRQAVLVPPVGQAAIPWRDSRGVAGGLLGGAAVGLASAAVLGLLAAGGAFGLTVRDGVLAGLVVGIPYGTVVGAIAGSTEPKPRVQRLQARLAPGGAAVTAAFDDGDDAARARELLLSRPGALQAV